MQNPWVNLPKETPFILPVDKPVLEKITWNEADRTRLQFETVPMPYIGNPITAQIILLALNPGFDDKDIFYQNTNQSLFADSISVLTYSCNDPFYLLNERYKETPAFRWYNNRLSQLIKATDRKSVAKHVAIIQYFPYHSREYRHLNTLVPSQTYNFFLVRQAIIQNKLIIFMRSKKIWVNAIPELETYPTVQLRSYRSPYLTKKNLGEETFAKVVNILQQ